VDVFIGNFGEPPLLFHNRSARLGNTNTWLTVTVEGTVSNRDGIGTRLWLTTPDGLTQMREINSGPTYGGGDYRAAYFGLGAHLSGTLLVRWPTGVMENLGTVSANQKLHLVEGQGLAAAAPVVGEVPPITQLEPNYPNPFNPETWIPYRLAKDAFVTLTLYEMRGNVVRTIDVGHRRAGVYVSKDKAIHWDGRNEKGERVASGVYFYTLTTDDFTATRKMLILK